MLPLLQQPLHPLVELQTQLSTEHVVPARHFIPHAPQLFESLPFGLMQLPEQQRSPPPHDAPSATEPLPGVHTGAPVVQTLTMM